MAGPKILTDRQISGRLRLRDLFVFSVVAQHGSMARAATDLGVSQPTVSEVISNLEHAYGVSLFDRSTRGVQLTIYGEALLRRSVTVFDELNQSARDMQFLADPTVGEVRLICLEGLSATVLPGMVRHFASRHPNVVLYIDNLPAPGWDMSGVRNRAYDLALVRNDIGGNTLSDDDDLNVETLYDDELVVAAGVNTSWVGRPAVSLAELIAEPWILSPPGYWHYARVEEAFRAQGLSLPKARIFSQSVNLRMDLMSNGPYITVFTGAVMRQSARHFGIVSLPVRLPSRPWPVVIVTLKNRTQSAAVHRFVESVRTVANSFSAHLQSDETLRDLPLD